MDWSDDKPLPLSRPYRVLVVTDDEAEDESRAILDALRDWPMLEAEVEQVTFGRGRDELPFDILVVNLPEHVPLPFLSGPAFVKRARALRFRGVTLSVSDRGWDFGGADYNFAGAPNLLFKNGSAESARANLIKAMNECILRLSVAELENAYR
ncbi:MAG TPA: hypothetical protein VJL32_03350 [Candidatus Paceibacterota bacterium]